MSRIGIPMNRVINTMLTYASHLRLQCVYALILCDNCLSITVDATAEILGEARCLKDEVLNKRSAKHNIKTNLGSSCVLAPLTTNVDLWNTITMITLSERSREHNCIHVNKTNRILTQITT